MAIKFSIVVPVNNFPLYKTMLEASLNNQTFHDYEIILIDTKKEKLASASSALNYGASLAHGKYLLFCHQDIAFLEQNYLQRLSDFVDTNQFGVAGCAGITAGSHRVYGNIVTSKDKIPDCWTMPKPIMEASTLDECVFVIPNYDFHGFCDYGKTWHLYAVDYCLTCQRKKESVLIFDLGKVWHLSNGDPNPSFFKTLLKVAVTYPELPEIRTTNGIYKNNSSLKKQTVKHIRHYRICKIKLFLRSLLHITRPPRE